MSRVVAFALLVLLTAGCLAPNDAPTVARQVCDRNVSSCVGGPTEPGAPALNVTSGAQPVWRVGDHWTYKLSNGQTVTAVVVAAGSSYEVRPTDNGTALSEAIFDFSTFGNLGLDLSGDTAAGRVKFFDWPLEENKTWSFTVDGLPMRAKANLLGDTWRITANSGNATMSYTYSPQTKWFTQVRWDYLDFGMQLSSAGEGYRGNAYVADPEPRYTYATGGAPTGTFTVSPGSSAVAVRWAYAGGQGFSASVRIVDPKGTAFAPFADVACSGAQCAGGDLSVYGATPGAWAVTSNSAGTGRLDLTIYEVTDTVKRVG